MKTIYLLIVSLVFLYPLQSMSDDLYSKLKEKIDIEYDPISEDILLKWSSEKLKNDSDFSNFVIVNKSLTFDFGELYENKIIIKRYEAVIKNNGEIEIKAYMDRNKSLKGEIMGQIILCCSNHTEKHCGNINEMVENTKSKGCTGLTAE